MDQISSTLVPRDENICQEVHAPVAILSRLERISALVLTLTQKFYYLFYYLYYFIK